MTSFARDLGLTAFPIGLLGLGIWIFAGKGGIVPVALVILAVAAALVQSFLAWREIRSAKRFPGWGQSVWAVFAPQVMAIESGEGTVIGAPYAEMKGARRSGRGLVVIFPDGSRVVVPRSSFASMSDHDRAEHYFRKFLISPDTGFE